MVCELYSNKQIYQTEDRGANGMEDMAIHWQYYTMKGYINQVYSTELVDWLGVGGSEKEEKFKYDSEVSYHLVLHWFAYVFAHPIRIFVLQPYSG